MILAFDTSTPACTAALFAADGTLFARADRVLGRGHAEYLAPMLAEMLGNHIPAAILVGTGPGSFTGLRIGIACAHGLAVGWDIPIHGFDSLALIAAGAPGQGPIAVAVSAGHGELFVAEFNRPGLVITKPAATLTPPDAAKFVEPVMVVGSGAEALVTARGFGEALNLLSSAADVMKLPLALRSLAPSPLYGRAPDARPLAA